jgi:hypothetical protein
MPIYMLDGVGRPTCSQIHVRCSCYTSGKLAFHHSITTPAQCSSFHIHLATISTTNYFLSNILLTHSGDGAQIQTSETSKASPKIDHSKTATTTSRLACLEPTAPSRLSHSRDTLTKPDPDDTRHLDVHPLRQIRVFLAVTPACHHTRRSEKGRCSQGERSIPN